MPSPFIMLQHILPQRRLTRMAGALAASTNPAIKGRLIDRFIKAYNVDMADAARAAHEYESFNDFFTRELKPGARPLADAGRHILSPADGVISQLGIANAGRIIQAKGREFTVTQLLGKDEALAHRFDGGAFITIYLSPRDYHRVHMPAAGTLKSTTYIPGKLFSVNQQTAQGVDSLFARNERLACLFEGPDGLFASVMVGAMIVSGINPVWPHRFAGYGSAPLREEFAESPQHFAAGDEMGRFYLGSTVVLLFEPGRAQWLANLAPGDSVRMGQSIGTRNAGEPPAG